jgi:hypothetical protein
LVVENNDRLRWGLLRRRMESWSSPSLSAHASQSSRLRLILLAPLALFLVWEVITRSVAAYLADASPETAIRLRSTNPTALLNLADYRLNLDPATKNVQPVVTPSLSSKANESTERTPDVDVTGRSEPPSAHGGPPRPAVADSQTTAQIRSWAELALLNDPLNARAFSILGQLSQHTPDEERTEALMQAAVRRSLFESFAVDWMMRKSYEARDYRATMDYAETLLRTRSNGPELVMPMLGQIAENPGASKELKEVLAGNPPWRTLFFKSLPTIISDARTPIDIFLSLKDTPTPPTPADFVGYLDFLVDRGLYELAYYTWLQFLPGETLSKAGYLFNGSFEAAPFGLPFDWVFTAGSGVTIDIARRPDSEREHALFMSFGPGRVNAFGVKQLVVLPPGSYQFRGNYKADITSQRGLVWRITCVRGPKTLIGESSPVSEAGASWKALEFSFTVPETDCPAQYVQLALDARSASEQFVSGSLWYDDLRIVREPLAGL